MAETLHFEDPDRQTAEEALPYRLELLDADGAVESLIATTRSAGLAYACYYGALREHPGKTLRLRRENQTLATSAPRDG